MYGGTCVGRDHFLIERDTILIERDITNFSKSGVGGHRVMTPDPETITNRLRSLSCVDLHYSFAGY